MSENMDMETVAAPEEAVVTPEEAVVTPEEPVVPVKAEKVKKVRKPRSVPVKILMGFIAFILCIVMFVVSLTGVAILNLRVIVSKGGITQVITQLIAGTPATSTTRPVLAGGADQIVAGTGSSGDMSGMLVDWAYEMIQDQFGEELEITKDQVQNFVENSTVKDFVADKAAGLVEDFYSGNYETTITKDEVVQLMKENAPLLEEQFGLVITEEEISIVEDALEESGMLEPIQENGLMGFIEQQTMGTAPDGDTIVGEDNSMMEGMQAAKEIIQIVRTATSFETVAILGAIFLVLLVLLFLVTGFSFPATLADTGVVLTLVGLIFSAPATLCLTQPGLLAAMLDPMVAGIVSSIILASAWVNYTVLGIGVALIVAAIVIKIVLCARKKAAA